MMPYYYYGWGGLPMIILWIAVAALFIWALSSFGRHRHWERNHYYGPNQAGPRQTSALDILNERYAKGEINKDEYDQKKKDLAAP